MFSFLFHCRRRRKESLTSQRAHGKTCVAKKQPGPSQVFACRTSLSKSRHNFSSSASALFRLCAVVASLALCTVQARAFTLSDPQVDQYNVRVGTQTFSGLYRFTTNNELIETANAITNMGSDVIKMELAAGYWGKYGITQNPSINSLMSLVKSEPSCRHVFDMPFHRYIVWAAAFSTASPDWKNGYTSTTDQANDYKEFYNLTTYLLTNYNNSGKTFYLGHWEGDGYLENNNWATNPLPSWCPGFVGYLNNRQKAIDDAKSATVFSNVNVFGYAECNRVRDAMNNGVNNNQRMINYVIPYVTNLDYVSYSSYDMQRLDNATKTSTMDYIEAHLPTNKVSRIPGERVWIGEYGYANAGDTPAQQEPETRAYIQWLLNYGLKGIPYILFWEIYDNETNADGSYKYFYLIDPNNVPAPCYYLHQRFLNNARLFTAQFKETNGRLPTDAEFVSLVSPQLNAPLPAPVNLSFSNQRASLLSTTDATVSTTFGQGVYGDDRAVISVYYGRQDGGTVSSAWENHQSVAVNTTFNPKTYTASLSNLTPDTNYFFRFYATNASGQTWTAASQFSTATLNPSDFGSRLKISFTGYNRGEALANFPLLVNLSTALPGFSYRQFASPIGGDLRFTDANGFLVLPYEIDEWNTNGTSRVWVRVPQMATTNDFIWVCWGNPAAATPPDYTTNGSVWSADHFLVWHLKQNSFPFADSANQFPALSGVTPSSTAGLIGLGCAFNGTSQYLASQPVSVGNAFTLSAMVKIDNTATNIQTIWANKPGGWNSAGFALFIDSFNTADKKLILETGDGTTGLTADTATGAVSFGAWHHIAAVVDRTGGSSHLYVDGSERTATGSILPALNNQANLNLGRFTNSTSYFKGVLDEVRIESATRSSNWIWASSMTASANTTLASYSTVTQQPPSISFSSDVTGLHFVWPGSAMGFSLYTATNLTAPILWSPATNQPTLISNQWQLSIPDTTGPSHFYRLQSQ
jgi:hypothetical protein